MKKIFISFSIALIALLMCGCETDFGTVAPYKEIMVVYGFLNPNASVQYVRISKAYLGEGNSLVMAQQKDSINYAPGVLEVKLQRIKDGIDYPPVLLDTTTSFEKNSGIFYAPYQLIYQTTMPILKDGSTYKLTVHNKQTGLVATSTTKITDDITITNIWVPDALNFTSNILNNVNFLPAENNGWVYNFTIRFHYKEVNLATPNDTVAKYVDWNFGDQVKGIQHSPVDYEDIYMPDFFRIVGKAIPADPNLVRIINPPTSPPSATSPIEAIFTSGTEDLYTYKQLQEPATGIVQERPVFTTMQNGIGIFTCRTSESHFKNLGTITIDALDTSSYTRHIQFQ